MENDPDISSLHMITIRVISCSEGKLSTFRIVNRLFAWQGSAAPPSTHPNCPGHIVMETDPDAPCPNCLLVGKAYRRADGYFPKSWDHTARQFNKITTLMRKLLQELIVTTQVTTHYKKTA